LDHLEGYMKSKPVRIGNAASTQLQFDIFGEVLTAINLYTQAGGTINEPMRDFVKRLVDYCCSHWKEKDAGIWEERDNNKHNTYSKLMCWVGVDRGIKIAKKLRIQADFERWETTKKQIKDDIIQKGFNKEIDSFVAYYGSKVIDTSTLNIPIFGLLAADDPKVLATMEQVIQKLVVDWFVLRTSDEKNDLREGEGAFFLSTFWLVDCLTLLGRTDEAKVWLERIIHDATPLGLYAEEFDPYTKLHLGNFPQAFTHLGLINSVLNLYQAQTFGTQDKWTNQSDRLLRVFKSLMIDNDKPLTPFGIRKRLKDILNRKIF
jgi:alpha,alpha-trehalase